MRYITFGFGILLILLAVLARVIGIDHDRAWGASRYLLLGMGLGLAGFSTLFHLYKTGRMPGRVKQALSTAGRAAAGIIEKTLCNIGISWALSAALLVGFLAYAAWYSSFGMFPTFTRVSNPYVDLGEAFLHGQVALLAKPDPQLVALADPYDYAQREKVPYLWDLSYYKGKYYAYWGPVPALLYAVLEAVTGAPAPDQTGVIVFTSGLGMILAVLLFRARAMFFPRAPGISIPVFLLAALVNLPVMHILERGQVYETSVIAGQFFLFLGLLLLLSDLDGKKPARLSLAGLSWGLAIGTRYNLALAVGVFVGFALLHLWKTHGRANLFRPGTFPTALLRPALALLAPLALCGLALALYNYARFDNPFETGLVYQLTVPVYQNRHFSPAFMPSNLYVYLFTPLTSRGSFPFFPSLLIDYRQLPAWAALPKGQIFDEVFFGLLPGQPIFWLLALLIPAAGIQLSLAGMRKAAAGQIGRPAGVDLQARPADLRPLRRQLTGLLGLAGALQFLLLLVYYFGANRFLVDFAPLWLLALIFLAWELDESLHRWSALRLVFWLAAALLALATAGIALLAGFDILPQWFRLYNPSLYGAIAVRANQIYARLAALPDSPGLLGAGLRLLLRLFAAR